MNSSGQRATGLLPELLPCPFCGSKGFLSGQEGEIVECLQFNTCGARAKTESWQRRFNRLTGLESHELEISAAILGRPKIPFAKTTEVRLADEMKAELSR